MIKIFKIGGGIIDSPTELNAFLVDFAKVTGNKVLVHGGGKGASKLLTQLGITPKMINGRRVTDLETLEVVTQLYAGKTNKNIVAQLHKNNCNAIGLSGADGDLITAKKRTVKKIDFGFVGDLIPEGVNSELISLLLNNNYTPIVCAITHDSKGQLLNTNADTIASTIAMALSKIEEIALHFCFDKIGVLKDINDDSSLIPIITPSLYEELKNQDIIHDGMLPKLENAFEVLNFGVKKVVLEHAKNINHDTKTTLCL